MADVDNTLTVDDKQYVVDDLPENIRAQVEAYKSWVAELDEVRTSKESELQAALQAANNEVHRLECMVRGKAAEVVTNIREWEASNSADGDGSASVAE